MKTAAEIKKEIWSRFEQVDTELQLAHRGLLNDEESFYGAIRAHKIYQELLDFIGENNHEPTTTLDTTS